MLTTVLGQPRDFNASLEDLALRLADALNTGAPPKCAIRVSFDPVFAAKKNLDDDRRDKLLAAGARGELTAMKWILAEYDCSKTAKPLLLEVCANGRPFAADWVVNACGLTTADVKENNCQLLCDVCAGAPLAMVVWFVARFNIGPAEVATNAYGALRTVAAAGRLEILEWLFALVKNHMNAAQSLNERHFYDDATYDACVAGRLDVLRLLVQHGNLGRWDFLRGADKSVTVLECGFWKTYHHYDDRYLCRALINGHVKVANYLWTFIEQHINSKPQTEVLDGTVERIIRNASAKGSLAAVKWAVAKFHLARRPDAHPTRVCLDGHEADAYWGRGSQACQANCPKRARSENNYALRMSCQNGHAEVVRYLCETFALTAADARVDDNCALRMSCQNGHVEVVRYLCETFAMTATDARTNNSYALRAAFENGHVEVARYLCDRFQPIVADLLYTDFFSLNKAIHNGHMGVLELFLAKFEPTTGILQRVCDFLVSAIECDTYGKRSDDVKYLIELVKTLPNDTIRVYVVCLACRRLPSDIVRLLAESFGLTASEVKRDKIAPLRRACIEKRALETVRYLVETFDLTSADARPDYLDAIRAAHQAGSVETVKWLMGAIGMQAVDLSMIVDLLAGK
ncbi:MAG: ankyrin repeat domain-containing protein [Gemmatimonadaceae bacterium]